jgi:hypothetical protein
MMDSQSLYAIRYVLEKEGHVLIESLHAGVFLAVADPVFTRGPSYSRNDLRAKIEAGFDRPALDALKAQPEEVVSWIRWNFTQDRGRERWIRGLSSRWGAIYAQ